MIGKAGNVLKTKKKVQKLSESGGLKDYRRLPRQGLGDRQQQQALRHLRCALLSACCRLPESPWLQGSWNVRVGGQISGESHRLQLSRFWLFWRTDLPPGGETYRAPLHLLS